MNGFQLLQTIQQPYQDIAVSQAEADNISIVVMVGDNAELKRALDLEYASSADALSGCVKFSTSVKGVQFYIQLQQALLTQHLPEHSQISFPPVD